MSVQLDPTLVFKCKQEGAKTLKTNNNMFKKCKAVMLSTNQKAHFGDLILPPTNPRKLLIFQHQNCTEFKQHLYITSDEEIKVCDWCYSKINNNIILWDNRIHKSQNIQSYGYNKIIATTDTSLKTTISPYIIPSGGVCASRDFYLPQPSQQFIEKYIEEYNKGNIITDILVEYEQWTEFSGDHYNTPIVDKLKVNPKDNTITIKKVKDSWTRNEVISLIKEFDNSIRTVRENEINYRNKWIEENL